MEEKRDTQYDIEKIRTDVNVIRLELAELRAAFFNIANEMKLMHESQKKQAQEFNSGIIACRQAFYRCKQGYDKISEVYENIEEGIDSCAGIISSHDHT